MKTTIEQAELGAVALRKEPVVCGPDGQAVPLLVVQHGEVSNRGLRLEANLGFEEWVQVGRRLCAMTGSVQFWIGDFINYGQAAFGDGRDVHGALVKREHGEKYRQALELFEYEYGSLMNMAWVAGRVGISRRREKLTWGHHYEVAQFEVPEQEHWLGLAEIGTDGKRWSVSQLRQAIRAIKAIQPNEPDNGTVGVGLKKKADDLKRAIKQLQEASPIAQWPKDQRDAMKKELEPLVTFWSAL